MVWQFKLPQLVLFSIWVVTAMLPFVSQGQTTSDSGSQIVLLVNGLTCPVVNGLG
jgi:hypothetical protein